MTDWSYVLFQSRSLKWFLWRGICGLCSLQWIFTTGKKTLHKPFPSFLTSAGFLHSNKKTTAAEGASCLCISPLLSPAASTIYFLPSYSLNLLVIFNKSNTKQSTPDSSTAPSFSSVWKWTEVASGYPLLSGSVRLLFHQFSRGYSS